MRDWDGSMYNMKLKNRKHDVSIILEAHSPKRENATVWAHAANPRTCAQRWAHLTSKWHHWWVTGSQKQQPNPTNNQWTDFAVAVSCWLDSCHKREEMKPIPCPGDHCQVLEALRGIKLKPLLSTWAAVDSSQLWWSPVKISPLFTHFSLFLRGKLKNHSA